VAAGVAMIVAIADVSASLLASFRRTVDTLAGSAALEVTNAGAGLEEDLLGEVRQVPGVHAAGGLVESFLPLADDPAEQILLLGVDFLESSVWHAQFPPEAVAIDDTVAFLAQADSVVLPRAFAARRGLETGGVLSVLAPDGPRTLVVRGTLEAKGAARLFGGALALMDLPAAQRLLGRPGRLDRIAVEVEPASALAPLERRLAQVVDGRGAVGTPEARGAQAERLLFSLRTMLGMTSATGVIVGSFLVYLTVAVSVRQRRRSLAVLSAVGVPHGAVMGLCVAEVVVLATIGALAGVLAGQGPAEVAGAAVGSVASEIWVRLGATEERRSIMGVLAAVALSVGIAAATAFAAARATFVAPTVEVLRTAPPEDEVRSASWARLAFGFLCLLAVWGVLLAPADLGFAAVVTLVVATHAFGYLALPVFARPIVSVLSRVAARLVRGWNGFALRHAVEGVSRNPELSAQTVAIVASAFAIAVLMAGLVTSFSTAWMQWLGAHFDADLYVGRGSRVRLMAGPTMGPDVRAAVAATDGVAAVEPFRTLPITFRGGPVFLEGISVDGRLRRGGLAMVRGTLEEAAPALRAGTGVLVSDNLAERLGIRRGETIDLPVVGGSRTFRVEGTFVDYLGSLDLGSVAVEESLLPRYWRDELANLLRVWLQPGVSAADVRARILEDVGRAQGLYVITARDFLADVQGVLDQFFAGIWALELVAVVLAVIGIVNAQVASVMDRGRELTVLGAIGVPGSAIRRMVVVECGGIGLMGALLGTAVGLMLGAQIVLVSLRLVTGWKMSYTPPLGLLLPGAIVVILVSALAGRVPGRLAGRLVGTPVVAE
jgi:putative ABC transport system permease protein